MCNKILMSCLLLVCSNLWADDCIYDEQSYFDFAKTFAAENEGVSLDESNHEFRFSHQGDQIFVFGGGCLHLGSTIVVNTPGAISQQAMLEKVEALVLLLGNWLIFPADIKASMANKRYTVDDGAIFIDIDDLTWLAVFIHSETEFSI